MKFSKVLPTLFSEFEKQGIDFALVGGLALYFSGAARTTFDADFLILLTQSDLIDKIMKRLGYTPVHTSSDVVNYVAKDPDLGQVDFLLAHRSYALAMLKRAEKKDVMGNPVKVLQPEDLIGLKVQSSSNDPKRASQDKADIENLLVRHAKTMNWALVQDYFRLFNREQELEEMRRRLL